MKALGEDLFGNDRRRFFLEWIDESLMKEILTFYRG